MEVMCHATSMVARIVRRLYLLEDRVTNRKEWSFSLLTGFFQVDHFESDVRTLRCIPVEEIERLQDLMNGLLRGVRAQPESVVRGVTKKLDILEQVSFG